MSAKAMHNARRDATGAIIPLRTVRERYAVVEAAPSMFSAEYGAWCARADSWGDTWTSRPTIEVNS